MKKWIRSASIATKLVLVSCLIVVVSIYLSLNETLRIFETQTKIALEDQNLRLAEQKTQMLESIFKQQFQFVKVLYQVDQASDSLDSSSFLSERQDILMVEFYSAVSNQFQLDRVKLNQDLILKSGLSEDKIFKLKNQSGSLPFSQVLVGKTFIKNLPDQLNPQSQELLLVFGAPLFKNTQGEIESFAFFYVLQESVQTHFVQNGQRAHFIVNNDGELLAHSNLEQYRNMMDFSGHILFRKSLESDISKKQIRYLHPASNRSFLGAYNKSQFGFTIIYEADEQSVLVNSKFAARSTWRKSGMILSFVVFIIFIFSLTVSKPLEKLVQVTHRIEKGDFEVRAFEEVRVLDEVGVLAKSIDQMVSGLKERDKVKSLFSKFHGSTVMNEVLNSDQLRQGRNLQATVFFSDIRGFTAFSEKHAPEIVVDMLNEYFAVMVEIINRNQGVVDKFIGDAIMAVWGAPHSHGSDAVNCIKSCLEMRLALQELNEKRKGRGLDPLLIGMGVHTGAVISGTIGSDQRLEFTVIGDTVNQASRIEASTKAFGTDLLISEETAHLVQDDFVLDLAGAAEVKGKSEKLNFFRVLGFKNQDGSVTLVETEGSRYAAEKVDKIKVA